MSLDFETLAVRKEDAVLFAEISAPPMNLLGPELVRDFVSLIQRAEADNAVQVLVFKSADPVHLAVSAPRGRVFIGEQGRPMSLRISQPENSRTGHRRRSAKRFFILSFPATVPS